MFDSEFEGNWSIIYSILEDITSINYL